MINDSQIPEMPTVRLNQEHRLDHPWIFSRNVVKPDDRIPPGTIVNVENPDGRWLGQGFFNARGRIGVRLLTTSKSEPANKDFIEKKITQAIEMRQELGINKTSNAMRLFNSEGDGISGLIVDIYDNTIVIEFFSAGAFRLRNDIKDIYGKKFPGADFYWFSEKRIQKQESFDCHDQPIPAPLVVHEHGLKFHVHIGSKHKTGFFVDQRDNRLQLSKLCSGKKVADLCSHTGGFAVYAAGPGKASSVTAVDLDVDAIEIAKKNADINDVKINFVAEDIYKWLEEEQRKNELYDVIILDPAKQTRNKDDIPAALAQYTAMNAGTMKLIKSGGYLLTCSCSGLISEEEFIASVRKAASRAGRKIQVIDLSGAAPDHPWLINVEESRYLKAIWCRVF
jgi:23S rRNA (cytosine1962-C5)-methyltransferase